MTQVPKRKLSPGEITDLQRARDKEARRPRRNFTPQQIINKRKAADKRMGV